MTRAKSANPDPESPGFEPELAVIGTGAMGCLFGARLARVARVRLLGTWAEGVDILQREGIRLLEGEVETMTPVRATNSPAGVRADIAVVLVKGHQTERAACWVAQMLAPDGVALTLQNGLGNLEILRAALGPQRVILGVTMQSATLLGPGHVRHGGDGPTIMAAPPVAEGRAGSVAALFRRAGFETHTAGNVDALVWGKLVANCAINPLTAILRVPNGVLAEHPDARAVMLAAAGETALVAEALGIILPYPDPQKHALKVAEMTAANHSSMLQDLLRGTPTEIEAINGAVVRIASKLGISTPVNETLLRLIHVLETKGRSQEPG